MAATGGSIVVSSAHPHPQLRGCHERLRPMGVCSAAQTAQAPWGSQAGCVYSPISVWGLQGAVLGGCNCAEGGEHEKYR